MNRSVDEQRVAQAVAVLDEASSPELIAMLLDVDTTAVTSVIRRLTCEGLLVETRYQHPDVRAGVLRDMPLDARTRLNRHAACVLHDSGGSASTIADLLLGAGDVHFPWALEVLLAATDDAMLYNQVDRAVKYLTLAYRVSQRATDRAQISSRLASIEWQANPSPVTRNFCRMRIAARAGLLDRSTLAAFVRYELWHGHIDDAVSALELLERSPSAGPIADDLAFLYAWLAYSYPDLITECRRDLALAENSRDDVRSAQQEATTLLFAITGRATNGKINSAAQRILTGHRLDSSTVEPLATAVDGLIHAERLDVAKAWCDMLLAEAHARAAPTWQSLFAGLRADIALRQGDLTAAEHYAVRALNEVPSKHLGTFVGIPMASLVRALTAANRLEEAQAHLDRAVPQTMFASRFGLRYLHARGHLRLATKRFDDAIDDFRTCGELMQRWNIDLPTLVPWRNDLAEAHLQMGDDESARELARLHVARLRDLGPHRTGGVSVRLLAATYRGWQRVNLLRESAMIARSYDDRFELIRVLAALADAYETVGVADRSRALARNAQRVARDSMTQLLRAGFRDPERLFEPQLPHNIPLERSGITDLSPAQLRVAELAAQGERNSEIARQLGITTSTVEQHLTRVYRKLRVSRRSELRFVLSRTPTSLSLGLSPA